MLSNLDIFSDAQAITVSGFCASAVNVGQFAGRVAIPVQIKVVTAFTNLTSLSISAQFASTEGGSYIGSSLTRAVAKADLVVGYQASLNFIPLHEVKDAGWMKLHYTVAGTTETTGAITAVISPGDDFVYKDGLFFSGTNPTGNMATA